MERDLATEVDALRAEMEGLAQAVRELRMRDGAGDGVGSAEVRDQMQSLSVAEGETDTRPAEQGRLAPARELAALAERRGVKGLISYAGSYESGQCGYLWASEECTAEELLGQDDDRVARVLAALGNKSRLALLKAILDKPASAADLVEHLGMGTTGQVYHHLKALQAADLVTQEERGQFAFIGHRAQGLLVLLAGVRDLLDTRYSAGRWAE